MTNLFPIRLKDSLMIILILFTNSYCCYPVVEDANALVYLQKFGYIDESNNGRSASMVSEDSVNEALKEFQRFGGINATGKMDKPTLKLMSLPRCGVKDIVGHSALARKKRYAHQGSKWRVSRLTYRISKYPPKIKDKSKVDEVIENAFKVWTDVANLQIGKSKKSHVNIDVRFVEKEHGDGDPFDGPGKTLAHAFFPQYGGNAHFDSEEKWILDGDKGTNLFQVAAHEFGHSLGLSHSEEKEAVMTPYYRASKGDYALHQDDITAIQTLYNKNKDDDDNTIDEGTGLPSDTSDAADLCQNATIDAVTRLQNGNTFVFKGNYYWRILQTGIANGYPRKISDDWEGLPGNLDAVLTWLDDTYFFKGNQFWKSKNFKIGRGYPQSIKSQFPGIPDNLDTAFVWSDNGKPYFFKGDQYWKFDKNQATPVSEKYPQAISTWKGLPNNIDAAFQWQNYQTYFFKDDKYYRFDDAQFEVHTKDPPYPRSTSIYWFNCRPIRKKSKKRQRETN